MQSRESISAEDLILETKLRQAQKKIEEQAAKIESLSKEAKEKDY